MYKLQLQMDTEVDTSQKNTWLYNNCFRDKLTPSDCLLLVKGQLMMLVYFIELASEDLQGSK
jgi:hypothetical protein